MSDSKTERENAELASLPNLAPEEGEVFRIIHKPAFSGPCTFAVKCLWVIIPFALTPLFWFVARIVSANPNSILDYLHCLFALFLITPLLLVLAYRWKNEFILQQSGITLPLIYFQGASRRLHQPWSNLTQVIFSRSQPALNSADQLVLSFQHPEEGRTTPVHIKLSEIDQLDLKKLVYAIVSNAPHAEIQPPLNEVALEFPTVSGIKHLNFQNFTGLWDEEFSTRYSPTLFVPLSPGEVLRGGAIKISELVACGGSAAIYAAKDREGKQIIVKEAVIPKNANAELKAKAIELFNREAMFLSKLDHPHIAKVFDHFVENDHHYEIIEFIDGLDLRRFVKERGPQPDDFVLSWAEQICEILVYLHSQNPPVIHRDLTPDNLVLRVDGQVVLIDFGAANAFVGIATGTMVGKQSYMPPEQLRGKAVPQSDTYSLGGTLYFLLTGKDPVPLEVSQIKAGSEATQDLNPILAKCTAHEVSARYQSSVELLEDIRSIRQQRLIEALGPHKNPS